MPLPARQSGVLAAHGDVSGSRWACKGRLPQKTVADVIETVDGFTWPDPTDAEDNERIDDLLHAAVKGTGHSPRPAIRWSLPTRCARRWPRSRNVLVGLQLWRSTAPRSTPARKTYAASFVSGMWTGEVAAYAVERHRPSRDARVEGVGGYPRDRPHGADLGGTNGSAVTPPLSRPSTQDSASSPRELRTTSRAAVSARGPLIGRATACLAISSTRRRCT